MSSKMLIDGDVGNDTDEVPYDFSFFMIGAGSGGVRASRFSAQYGAKWNLGAGISVPTVAFPCLNPNYHS
ncbi:hypothetical protein L2E82_07981 [Cichorium intybus]|uniref:Uncharacterized protein n=1 Tax=Cichorium intybus TaxID=13427 RepID=A0ACB9G6E9_CICIN|nr:hypothetical protein L2E82_07981 [Cichorium intybus]